MRIKGKKNRLITATAIFLAVFGIVTQAGIAMVTAGTPYTGSYGNYYLNDVSRPISDGDCGYTTVSKEASFHFEFMSNGETVTYVEERRIKPKYAKSICWGKPEVVCCNHCELLSDDGNRYSMQIFLEDDNGNEYCRKSGSGRKCRKTSYDTRSRKRSRSYIGSEPDDRQRSFHSAGMCGRMP